MKLAVIAHDGKEADMVFFLNKHLSARLFQNKLEFLCT